MPRFFTLTQAREYLPRVKSLIELAVRSKSEFETAEERTRDFVHRVMSMGGMLVDRAPFIRNREGQMRSGEKLKEAVTKIQGMGVQVKDLDLGLIDFPTLFKGDEVYLCWRLGEDDLVFWHGVQEGFSGRKVIDDEFIRNHRGRDAD